MNDLNIDDSRFLELVKQSLDDSISDEDDLFLYKVINTNKERMDEFNQLCKEHRDKKVYVKKYKLKRVY